MYQDEGVVQTQNKSDQTVSAPTLWVNIPLNVNVNAGTWGPQAAGNPRFRPTAPKPETPAESSKLRGTEEV